MSARNIISSALNTVASSNLNISHESESCNYRNHKNSDTKMYQTNTHPPSIHHCTGFKIAKQNHPQDTQPLCTPTRALDIEIAKSIMHYATSINCEIFIWALTLNLMIMSLNMQKRSLLKNRTTSFLFKKRSFTLVSHHSYAKHNSTV